MAFVRATSGASIGIESITDGHGAAKPPGSSLPADRGPHGPTPPGASDPTAFRQGVDRALGVARHGDFARLLAAQSASAIGSQFTAVALPLLAALSLGASPLAFGVLASAAGLPHLLFGLFAGAWVDRLRRRPVMIAADVARAVLLATIRAWRSRPIACWAECTARCASSSGDRDRLASCSEGIWGAGSAFQRPWSSARSACSSRSCR